MITPKEGFISLLRRRAYLSKRIQADTARQLSFDWMELSAISWAIDELRKVFPDEASIADAHFQRKCNPGTERAPQ